MHNTECSQALPPKGPPFTHTQILFVFWFGSYSRFGRLGRIKLDQVSTPKMLHTGDAHTHTLTWTDLTDVCTVLHMRTQQAATHTHRQHGTIQPLQQLAPTLSSKEKLHLHCLYSPGLLFRWTHSCVARVRSHGRHAKTHSQPQSFHQGRIE